MPVIHYSDLEMRLGRRDCSDDATKFAYLIDKNKSFARPSRAFLIPCISFKFSANLRLEMTISQVLQRTWTLRRKFEYSFLPLTPHL